MWMTCWTFVFNIMFIWCYYNICWWFGFNKRRVPFMGGPPALNPRPPPCPLSSDLSLLSITPPNPEKCSAHWDCPSNLFKLSQHKCQKLLVHLRVCWTRILLLSKQLFTPAKHISHLSKDIHHLWTLVTNVFKNVLTWILIKQIPKTGHRLFSWAILMESG